MKKYEVKLTEDAKQDRKSLARFVHHIIPQKMVIF